MKQVKALVLRAAGINCDYESVHALELAGAAADRIHINRVIENTDLLKEYQILLFPGGFSYGDDVAAGKILANQIVHHLSEPLTQFLADGKLMLGICNGFQVLAKTGILPGFADDRAGNKSVTNLTEPAVSVIDNDSGKFEDRWAYLQSESEHCVFIKKGQRIYLPVAHGEGKVVTRDESVLSKLENEDHIAFRYVDADGKVGGFPVNPNGSFNSIAGLTDSTGRVLGLMPHPERFVRRTQHPHWTRLEGDSEADGMIIFNNAVEYVKKTL
ncbi:Phosphoribosylformylglycinamidine synthase 1 [Anaerohalosphaera lusitana]|uniref:Phosphoribosylformylglycinamidine synthase 1 n=1 Tax=Anaerohalosphaera lusitana TaxID=1936003 RepID=A0A1U9NMQ0_9BACT|nr:phosphoribosylformylglycinamidine synthase I [Anaerohalosphaera lusitana]AQT69014.1 Phosphoribosylformylglycinamidine synthase 1 [Anaerohalosphaera lusitana]